jgi:hypothetical protein
MVIWLYEGSRSRIPKQQRRTREGISSPATITTQVRCHELVYGGLGEAWARDWGRGLEVEEEEIQEAPSSKLEEGDEGEVLQLVGVELWWLSCEAPVRWEAPWVQARVWGCEWEGEKPGSGRVRTRGLTSGAARGDEAVECCAHDTHTGDGQTVRGCRSDCSWVTLRSCWPRSYVWPSQVLTWRVELSRWTAGGP